MYLFEMSKQGTEYKLIFLQNVYKQNENCHHMNFKF